MVLMFDNKKLNVLKANAIPFYTWRADPYDSYFFFLAGNTEDTILETSR